MSGFVVSEKVGERAAQNPVLDPRRAPLERARHVPLPPVRHHGVDELRERAERADAPAVDAAPEHRRDHGDDRQQVPGEVGAEDRQVAAEQAEHVDDRNQQTLRDTEERHRGDERDVLQAHALAEEADEREHQKRGDQGRGPAPARADRRPRWERPLLRRESPSRRPAAGVCVCAKACAGCRHDRRPSTTRRRRRGARAPGARGRVTAWRPPAGAG